MTRGAGRLRGSLPPRASNTSRLLRCSMRAADVGAVDAVRAEQLFGHARDRRRAVDLEFRNAIRALVPSLQHQPPVVHAVVVVEVGEERVGHVDRAMAALDQALMRAGAVVPDDEIGANLDQVSGTLPRQRGRRRAGAEQRDGERASGGRLFDGRNLRAAAVAAATGETATDAMKSLRSKANLRAEPTWPRPRVQSVLAWAAACQTATVRVAVSPLIASPLVVASSSAEPSRKMPSLASVICAALRTLCS